MDAMEFVVEKQLKSLLLDEDPTKIEFPSEDDVEQLGKWPSGNGHGCHQRH